MSALGPNELLVAVRFADVDLMGVVHHSRYWTWFEEARFHFLSRILGVTPEEVQLQEIYTPLVSSSCTYGRAVRWGEEVVVAVRMEVDRGARFRFCHEVRTADGGQRVASALTTHVFTDLQMRLKLTVPPFYRDRLRAALAGDGAAYIDAPSWSPALLEESTC